MRKTFYVLVSDRSAYFMDHAGMLEHVNKCGDPVTVIPIYIPEHILGDRYKDVVREAEHVLEVKGTVNDLTLVDLVVSTIVRALR